MLTRAAINSIEFMHYIHCDSVFACIRKQVTIIISIA